MKQRDEGAPVIEPIVEDSPIDSEMPKIYMTLAKIGMTLMPVVCVEHKEQRHLLTVEAAMTEAEQIWSAFECLSDDKSVEIPFFESTICLTRREAYLVFQEIAMVAGGIGFAVQMGLFLTQRCGFGLAKANAFVADVFHYGDVYEAEWELKDIALGVKPHSTEVLKPKHNSKIWIGKDPLLPLLEVLSEEGGSESEGC